MGETFDNEIKTLKTDVQLRVDNIEEIDFKSCYETAVVYVGGGMENPRVPNVKSAKKCQDFCKARKGCKSWTWLNSEHNRNKECKTCWLKQ